MLNRDQLNDLYRKLRHDKVLSLYLDGRATDFSERSVWRRRMEKELREARSHAEANGNRNAAAFDRARERLLKELDAPDEYLPDQGWVGFATPDEVWYAEPVRAPMPDLARWEEGIRVAPYVRALKQERPVVLVLVDRQRARVFVYRNGRIEEPENLLADLQVGDLSDVNIAKRPTNVSGVRGKTGTDAAQDTMQVHTERFIRSLMDRVGDLVGREGFLVLGGTPETVAALRQHSPDTLEDRTLVDSSLHLDMTLAQVREAAERAASQLTQRMQESLLDEVMEQANAGGRGAVGSSVVEKALREGRVDTLLLSRGFIAENPDYADHLVGGAFEQQGEVEELSSAGGERLDVEGHGVGARLRYRIAEPEATTERGGS